MNEGKVFTWIFWGSGGGEGKGGERFITTLTTASAPFFWIPTSIPLTRLPLFFFYPLLFFPLSRFASSTTQDFYILLFFFTKRLLFLRAPLPVSGG